jgi:hypothetical protein
MSKERINDVHLVSRRILTGWRSTSDESEESLTSRGETFLFFPCALADKFDDDAFEETDIGSSMIGLPRDHATRSAGGTSLRVAKSQASSQSHISLKQSSQLTKV